MLVQPLIHGLDKVIFIISFSIDLTQDKLRYIFDSIYAYIYIRNNLLYIRFHLFIVRFHTVCFYLFTFYLEFDFKSFKKNLFRLGMYKFIQKFKILYNNFISNDTKS